MKYLKMLLMLAVIFSCTENKDKVYYFEGEFAYYADAAIFLDCATGDIFPVVMDGDYLSVERGYNEFNPKEGERIMCKVMGYIKDKPVGEEGRPKQLFITKLIGFTTGDGCNTETIIAGEYKSDKGELLKLNSNYNYELKSDKKIICGVWGRTSEDKIELSESNIEGTVNIKTMKLLLNDVIYRRVYSAD